MLLKKLVYPEPSIVNRIALWATSGSSTPLKLLLQGHWPPLDHHWVHSYIPTDVLVEYPTPSNMYLLLLSWINK